MAPYRLVYGRWVASAACSNPVSSTQFFFPPCLTVTLMLRKFLPPGMVLESPSFKLASSAVAAIPEAEAPRMSQKIGHGSYTDLAAALQKYLMTTYYVASISPVTFSSRPSSVPKPQRQRAPASYHRGFLMKYPV